VKVPKLRQVRERAYLTQAELAKKSKVTESTISRLEAEHQEARISTVRKLAEALGVKPEELTG
jgi:transcriptional regulator with XRE-family HTH domain